jgi:hypothetical protein
MLPASDIVRGKAHAQRPAAQQPRKEEAQAAAEARRSGRARDESAALEEMTPL